MNNIFLLVGSNQGDRLQNLRKVKGLVSERIGKLIGVSHIHETEPWGYESTKSFYNQCLILESKLNSDILLNEILNIEKELGRIRNSKSFTDRIIDIDILFFNNECIHNADLTIPHPRLHERRFVLEPLAEIAPDFLHPVFKNSIRKILDNSTDRHLVRKLEFI